MKIELTKEQVYELISAINVRIERNQEILNTFPELQGRNRLFNDMNMLVELRENIRDQKNEELDSLKRLW